MKIAITGGAGYIGSVATHRLANMGADLLVLDDLSQGHREALPAAVRFAQIDVRDEQSLVAEFHRFQPDAVMHFAALTIAPASVQQPEPYWKTNAGGTLAVLDAMRSTGVRAIVFSSTAAVYGNPNESRVLENAPRAPINPYGASKLAAEQAISSYALAYDLTFTAFRYFNVAGATAIVGEDHRPETHLIPSVLDAAAGRRGPLAVYGVDFPTPDGTAIRDYVHVEDLIDAHMLALTYQLDGGESLGALNLGTHHGASVREVIAAVERITGMAVPVVYADRRPGDPASLVADATRSRDLLGWNPGRSTLEEMVSSAWRWRQQFPHGYGTRR